MEETEENNNVPIQAHLGYKRLIKNWLEALSSLQRPGFDSGFESRPEALCYVSLALSLTLFPVMS